MRDFQLPGRSSVFAQNGMCATSHPLAAKVAVQILESGGNAVDAAIAAAVVLGICEPASTGIGGDCFALIKPAGEDRIVSLNGSGRAPQALDAANLRAAGHKSMPLFNAPEAVTMPGAIDAFCRLSKDWGRIGLKASLAPAIYYADSGVPVGPRTAFDWKSAGERLTGDARKYYLINSKPPKVGQIFQAPLQAEVLRKVAMKGRSGFYEGEIAKDMCDSLNALGGVHTLDDFSNVACNYTDPISGTYKEVELVEHPPNGQGATALLMNSILSEFDIAAMDPFGAQRAHIEAEASKLAYDARDRFIADIDFANRIDHMLDPLTAKKLAALIDPKQAIAQVGRVTGAIHKDTVLLTVVDKDLMAVTMIYSIFHGFGSGLASKKFGINFQNRGAGFSLEDGHPNQAAGGKRPLHTIIPAMLRKDGRVIMPFGVMGGAYQPCGHARLLSNMVDFGMHPQEALDGPRSFPDEGVLNVERGYTDVVRDQLADMGHRVEVPATPLGGAQAIRIDYENGVLEGATDPRKDGCALGY